MMVQYIINEMTARNEDGEACRVWGITAMRGTETVREIFDLFCDREAAEKLAALCNALNLDPDQLDDVAEDSAAEAAAQ